jgi:hypothetical protein
MPVILALGKLKQEDPSSRPALGYIDLVSKTHKYIHPNT